MGGELPVIADLWAWYAACASSWVGYAIGAAVAAGVLVGVGLGLVGSSTNGKE